MYISNGEDGELDSGGAGGGAIKVMGAFTKRPRTRSGSDLRGGNMVFIFVLLTDFK